MPTSVSVTGTRANRKSATQISPADQLRISAPQNLAQLEIGRPKAGKVGNCYNPQSVAKVSRGNQSHKSWKSPAKISRVFSRAKVGNTRGQQTNTRTHTQSGKRHIYSSAITEKKWSRVLCVMLWLRLCCILCWRVRNKEKSWNPLWVPSQGEFVCQAK